MFWHIDMDIICSAFAIIILIDCRKKLDFDQARDKCFWLCIIMDLAASLAELVSSVVMEVTVSNATFHLATIPYYAIFVLPIVIWFDYTCCIVFTDNQKVVRNLHLFGAIPYACYLAVVISNLWTGLFYYLDADGTYHRGPLFFLSLVLFCMYTLVIILLVIVKGKRIPERQLQRTLLLMPILIAVGVALQLSVPGWLMIMPCYSLALLVAFLFVQNQKNRNIVNKLVSVADTDHMTQLLNRIAAQRAIEMELESSKANSLCALLIIDIDDLKNINDTLGHPAGDAAIQLTAATIKMCFRSTDIVARIGGDEFAVFLKDVTNQESLEQIIEKLLSAFATLVAGEGNEGAVSLRCSVGASLCACSDANRAALYRLADSALYYAKRTGKNCYRIFSEESISR